MSRRSVNVSEEDSYFSMKETATNPRARGFSVGMEKKSCVLPIIFSQLCTFPLATNPAERARSYTPSRSNVYLCAKPWVVALPRL